MLRCTIHRVAATNPLRFAVARPLATATATTATPFKSTPNFADLSDAEAIKFLDTLSPEQKQALVHEHSAALAKEAGHKDGYFSYQLTDQDLKSFGDEPPAAYVRNADNWYNCTNYDHALANRDPRDTTGYGDWIYYPPNQKDGWKWRVGTSLMVGAGVLACILACLNAAKNAPGSG
eukprot:TRINITY_DN242_c5_g1_i1.p1 TRINITY_DN242_c5_g1~~TRINITY_DN242_c5_g1_i1.p1  ORF type:complete len:177 (+),score=69.85 TRINITY_DN242_c5_g1_i1:264-794(+)